MLYLFYSSGYFKIGYTADLKRRKKDYDTHNPDYELMDHTEGYGDKLDEAELHRKIADLRHNNSEWFKCDPGVIKVWAEYKLKMGDLDTDYKLYFENLRASQYDIWWKIPYNLPEGTDAYTFLKNTTEEELGEIQSNYFLVNDKIFTANFSKMYLKALLTLAKNTKGLKKLYNTIGDYMRINAEVNNHKLHIFSALYCRKIISLDKHYIGFINNKYIKFT